MLIIEEKSFGMESHPALSPRVALYGKMTGGRPDGRIGRRVAHVVAEAGRLTPEPHSFVQ